MSPADGQRGEHRSQRQRRSGKKHCRSASDTLPAEVGARIRFRTETGSLYEVTYDAGRMTWRRVPSLASGVLRSESGVLLVWPEIVLGQRCQLWSEPLVPSFPRLVLTSIVVAVLDVEAGSPSPFGSAP